MSQNSRVVITHEFVSLLTVRGGLDWVGLLDVQQQIDLLLDAGARFLIADLSRVGAHDDGLFDLLIRTGDLLRHRSGWLRLIGPDSSVVSTLGATTLLPAAPNGTHVELARPS